MYKLIFLILTLSIILSCTKKDNVEISSINNNCTLDLSEPDTYDKDELVWIPSGYFTMGADKEKESLLARLDEYPNQEICVNGFLMDRAPVTNRKFKKFVDETGYITTAEQEIDWDELKKQLPPNTPKPSEDILKPGSMVFVKPDELNNLSDFSQWWKWTIGASWKHPEGPVSNIDDIMDHPVVHISWYDAQAYAQWIHGELPTEVQWEYAARGGEKNTVFFWGDDESKLSENANTWSGPFPYNKEFGIDEELDGYIGTSPVKSFPANQYGLYDMAGNVWEWTVSVYTPNLNSVMEHHNISKSIDARQISTKQMTVRGGSFLCHQSYCASYRLAARMRSSPDSGLSNVGFRVIYPVNN